MTKAATNTVTPAGLSPARKTTNLLMGGLIVLATAVVVAPLILIFAYLLKEGVSALNADFFTKVPAPEGEKGGGLLNAILGSLEMLAMASVIGVTVGVAGGIFLSEYPRHPLMPTIRMLSDVLAGIPAIVMGLVAYGLMVLTMGRFSGLAGALALGFLMIPIVVRTTEEVLKLVPMTVREAGGRSGPAQVAGDHENRAARRRRGHHHRRDAGARPRRRGKPRRCCSRPSAITSSTWTPPNP